MGIESLALMIVAAIGPTTVIASNLLYLGTMAALYAGVAYGTQMLGSLFVDKPSVPKAEDGSYNLKQNVPPLPIVYGTVKKGGDYVFLEEKEGVAYHILVWCGRRIGGFVTHYLHDETVTIDGATGNVTAPAHFVRGGTHFVNIQTRLGLDAETAYADVVAAFSPNWTADHRGDGLASILMACKTASQKRYLEVYPNQMPEHSAVGNGALLYDPRKDSTQPGGSGSHRYDNPNSWEFSRNLALMRLDHLCKPYGGKLSYARMYMPDWINAANVCDQNVTNRSGGTEKRYHGGIWFRANNDPIEVARIIDEAAEMIVYERSDGKIGVHAGEYVAPDLTLTENHIFAISVDKNKSQATTVLAVRGRYTNTANNYATEDAAIYGDPYGEVDDSTERTRTFNNSAVQSHNHCQRKQKLTYIRANAWRVQVTADYSAAKNCAYRRFVIVNYPDRGLVNAVVEITSTVSTDLANMRVTFAGIVVSSSLYDFNAATEEGSPGQTVTPITPGGVPEPTGFTPTIETEVVAGGSTAAYILGVWDHANDSLIHEMEYQRTDEAEPAVSVFSNEGEDSVRSGYLADGEEYRVRLRAFGGGTPSDWTDYEVLTATADPVAPGVVTGASLTGGVGEVTFDWTAPNSPNYFASRLYLNTTNDFSTSTLVATEYGAAAANDARIVTGLTAGTFYGWVVAINSSGVPSAEVATGSAIVT